MTDLSPIRREVVVELDPPRAFALFTDGIGDWWPLAEHGVFGGAASVAFRDGQIIESCGGETSLWGTVQEWRPGERLSFSWHPGAPAERASTVTVSFDSTDGGQTRVVLEHSGWEVFDDPAGARADYDQGWPGVLGHYRDAAARPADAQAYTWVALMHRPGPEAPEGGSIFQDPRFADHAQFLGQMQEEGYLVAAGPLLDETGAGMTILRLPGEGRLEDAKRLATTEDRSVRDGFFTVSVRPWQVMMSR